MGQRIQVRRKRMAQEGEAVLHFLYLHFLSDQVVQPASINLVVLKALGLQQLDQILDCCSEIPSDRQLFQCYNHVPSKERATLFRLLLVRHVGSVRPEHTDSEPYWACTIIAAPLPLILFPTTETPKSDLPGTQVLSNCF